MNFSPSPPLSLAVINELRAVVGHEHVLLSPEDLLAYSIDGTWNSHRPQVVVLPMTAKEVAQVVIIAGREGLPITPRGSSSGLSGGAIPAQGGISLALTRMRRIIEISVTDQVVVVEPGVITGDLQQAVEKQNLFYPPDPSSLSISAIGGNIAENAGGARCLKYGVTSDYVLALEVVLASGAIIRTGGRTVKNVTGYNLRSLFVGSEGTLGIVTEATLRLLPKPRYQRTAVAHFASVEAAASATTAILAAGIIPTSIELLDRTTLTCVEAMMHIGLPTDIAAMLLFQVDGQHESAVADDITAVAQACLDSGATAVQQAANDAEAQQLWRARRAVSPSLARQRPNKLGEDIAVPRSKIAAMIHEIHEIAATYRVTIPVFGHAGDGNLHPNILCDLRDADEMQRVQSAATAIFTAAIKLGGTLSGEHGIGLLKQEFMKQALGAEQLAAMRAIKDALDPQGILNPGKIFPTGRTELFGTEFA